MGLLWGVCGRDAPAHAQVGIYSDSLQNGWADRSWAKPRNLANPSPVAAGTRSISVDFGPWTALSFSHAALDGSAYTSLVLKVNGGANTNNPRIAVQAVVGGSETTAADIRLYCSGGAIPSSAWTTCTIPLAAFGANVPNLTRIHVREFAGANPAVMYFDEIGLTTSAGPGLPSAPAPPTVTAAAGAVTVSWRSSASSTRRT